MSGVEYLGFQNLAGRTFGKLTVLSLASRQPLMWQVRCECGCSWREHHTRLLTNPQCRNSACGRAGPASPRVANIVVPTPAIRSADSASARQFLRSQKTTTTFASEPSAQGILNADTGGVIAYLNDRDERKQ